MKQNPIIFIPLSILGAILYVLILCALANFLEKKENKSRWWYKLLYCIGTIMTVPIAMWFLKRR